MIKNKKGFTLIEILLITGVVSLASIATYAIFNSASAWYTSNQEVENLNGAIDRIERAVGSSGTYSSINRATLESLGGFNTKLNLADISSPSPNVLNLRYDDINSNICSKFVSKIIDSRNNLTILVNSVAVNQTINSISQQCNNDSNTITISLRSNISTAGLTPVVPTP